MPRYRRHSVDGRPVFLTLVCHARRPWLGEVGARAVALERLDGARRVHPFLHHGHVLLDDHLHLMLTPAPGTQVPLLVGSFKRAVQSRLSGEAGHGRLWQRRYFDHVIRDADDFARHLDYLHFNPVKHGLVRRAGDWRWSSFGEWAARGVYAPDWGSVAPEDLHVGECGADGLVAGSRRVDWLRGASGA